MQENNVKVETENLNSPKQVNLTEIHRNSDGIALFDVNNEDGARIGWVKLHYWEEAKRVFIGNVRISRQFRGHGYGIALYKAIALISPGYIFHSVPRVEGSSGLSDDATMVWESLVNKGLAERNGINYIFITGSE